MKFFDITHDQTTHYRLTTNEAAVFFMLNRTGDVVFELNASGAAATILSLFLGETGEHNLTITQRHAAPQTNSAFLGKALVGGDAKFRYAGLITIEEQATLSEASQECRNVLLSANASAHARPALEIKTDDVRCHHAATTSTLLQDALFFTQSRGLSSIQAQKLLTLGFARTVLDAIPNEFSEEKRTLATKIGECVEKILA